MKRKFIPLLILCLLLTTAEKCSPDQQKSLREQAVNKLDSIANGIKATQGSVEDLYHHHKISAETVRAYTEKLNKANGLGMKAQKALKDWLAAHPTGEPDERLKLSLSGILSEIEDQLGTSDNAILQSVGETLRLITQFKELLK
jgi:hypothetical protein